MNSQQLSEMAKPLIGALVAYLAASHIFFDAQTWNIILTALVSIGLAIWAYKQNTILSQVSHVDAMAKDKSNPVKAIIVEATPAGSDLANAIPGMTTIVAGTAAARSASENGSPAVRP